MSTRNKYDFFEARYNEEIERMRDLQRKAQIYLSIISIVSSILLINLSSFRELIREDSSILITAFILLLILLFVLFFLLNSIRLKNYTLALNPSEFINEYPETGEYEDCDFYENRIANFINSIQDNQRINAEKASSLQISEYGLFGLIFMVIVITLQIIV